MFKKKVSCVINKEDTTRIIDAMCAYGTVRFDTCKDGRRYKMSIKVRRRSVMGCLETLMKLAKEGVAILKPNIG